MKILNNINVGIVMNMDIAQKNAQKKESTKSQISKSKKRREKYHTLIRQKDAIINQQKFLIDDMTKDIKRLTKEISELKFESLYYEP